MNFDQFQKNPGNSYLFVTWLRRWLDANPSITSGTAGGLTFKKNPQSGKWLVVQTTGSTPYPAYADDDGHFGLILDALQQVLVRGSGGVTIVAEAEGSQVDVSGPIVAVGAGQSLFLTSGARVVVDAGSFQITPTTLPTSWPGSGDTEQVWNNNGFLVVGNAAAPVLSGGAAGGDLTGTYPNPTIAAGKVTLAKWAAGILDTDGTLAADSDTRVPSQKAVKTYVDNLSNNLDGGAAASVYLVSQSINGGGA